MMISSATFHRRTLSSAGNPFSGYPSARRQCEFPPRPRNFCSSNKSAGPRSLQMTASQGAPFSRMAVDSNMSEDMFDDLLKKYGKVVFTRNHQRPATASPEVYDDAETFSLAVALAKVTSDVKAADIKLLFVKPVVCWTQFFIIATAFSKPQIAAIGTRIRDLAEAQYGRTPSGDSKPNSWTLLDFGDVVVHIFLPGQRVFYNLEEFYGNATPIELPFAAVDKQ